MSHDDNPVLVVGATGNLGGQVVDKLLARGKTVRALVRPSSDASRLEGKGVEIARGDMLDLDSLVRAMRGADAVVSTAAGYTRRSRNADEVDTVGNANLARAAHEAGVRRFVLTSILTCDRTPDVSHFWHKKLAEDKLEELGVPFVALRPGAFLDQITQMAGDPFAKKRLIWLGSKTVPLTFVLTVDVAGHLATAIDAPGLDGQRIDIGWDRPASMQDIAGVATGLLGEPVKVRAVPGRLVRAMGVLPMFKDMSAMLAWFETGNYVADPTRQREVFGPVPTARDAVTRFATGLGHVVRR
jgi:uncharacterized protein YbjT (DUF2867 family)